MSETADKIAGLNFVHLRVRSAYALLDGAMTVKKIAGIAVPLQDLLAREYGNIITLHKQNIERPC